MVTCKICNKKYKRIDTAHLKNKHGISVNDYLIKYPNSDVISDATRNKYSIAQTKYASSNVATMANRSKKAYQTLSSDMVKLNEWKSKIGTKSSKWWKDVSDCDLQSRNDKISNGKKAWWATQDKSILNEWLSEWRYSEAHINMCKSNQKKATKAALGRGQSKPEKAFEAELVLTGIEYESQYYVGRYPFDFYIPSKNLLIEIDGEFYHPLTESDCKYPIQVNNYKRDKLKTKVAIDSGYELKRIRV